MPIPIRFDAVSLPPLVMGALLLLASVVIGLKQWWAHRRLVLNPKVDEVGYAHSERQIRNRLVVAIMLFLLGAAIPVGDQLDFFFRGHAGLFFAYWMGVLLIVFAMVVLALGDLLSTLAYARVSQVKLRVERRELEEEIRRYRAARNGQAGQEIDDPKQNG
ncbi:MAG: hypothetical protein JSS49_13345 [Planctomycetes bacterium]|nr:hypothetical protein [Planctomycetota bacterium]